MRTAETSTTWSGSKPPPCSIAFISTSRNANIRSSRGALGHVGAQLAEEVDEPLGVQQPAVDAHGDPVGLGGDDLDPVPERSASAARATMSAISEASNGAENTAKTCERSAAITSSGVVCAASSDHADAGRGRAHQPELRHVLLDARRRGAQQHVVGPPPQPAQRVERAGGGLDVVALEQRRSAQGRQQVVVGTHHQDHGPWEPPGEPTL